MLRQGGPGEGDRLLTWALPGPRRAIRRSAAWARKTLGALHARAGAAGVPFASLWALADLDGDGRLSRPEFCLFMAGLKAARAGRSLPPHAVSLTQARPAHCNLGPSFSTHWRAGTHVE